MSVPPPTPAQMAALVDFNTEAFVLLGIGLAITGLRSYARMSSVGWKGLWADDFLVLVAAVFYIIETVLAYMVGNKAMGLANNSMTDEQRASLSPDSQEYHLRVLGSKIQLCGWTSYSILLWTLKGAICTFYQRLTKDLKGFRPRIDFGFGFIGVSWLIVMLNLLLSCNPLSHMWQINPDPGPYCQPAISPALIWTYLAFNVATDLYLIAIPMPMLFRAAMPWWKRLRLVLLFSCGLFVTMAAILRVVLLVSDPVNGPQLAGSWAVRETFVAVVTTNLPVLFPHLRRWLAPIATFIGIKLNSTRGSSKESSYPTSLDSWQTKVRAASAEPTALSPTPDIKSAVKMAPIVPNLALADLHKSGAVLEDVEELSKASTSDSDGDFGADGTVIERRLDVIVEDEQTEPRVDAGGNYTTTWADSAMPRKPDPVRTEYFADHIHQDAYKES